MARRNEYVHDRIHDDLNHFLNETLMLSLQDGTSNYLKGLMLILCYLIVAASFFVHIDPALVGKPSVS